MNTQNVNTAAAESTETRFNGDKIRRALRRPLFVPGFPEINTVALRTQLGFHIDSMTALNVIRSEYQSYRQARISELALELTKPQERLLISVEVVHPETGGGAETFAIRVVHAANRLDDASVDARVAEYETTNVWKAEGVVTPHAKQIFEGELNGLERYGLENMQPGYGGNPFGPWRFEREQG
ncbi:hypothetical protein [Erwinia rhapontici]|uniref:hypothetical protein n=1 Tax=Erwinia rhapontici TaxID=55212 RepID=UPI0013318E92|nr:hypothetical protein [Erwinia rhapontici]MBP2157374.1 hypothetical protein [Erwinia rhapontici]